jgi:hypothetical protein
MLTSALQGVGPEPCFKTFFGAKCHKQMRVTFCLKKSENQGSGSTPSNALVTCDLYRPVCKVF